MKILLLKSIPEIGKQGEVVEVSSGYAKNALLPKKLAVIATPNIIYNWEQKKKKELEQKEERKRAITKLFSEIQDQTFLLSVRTGKNKEIFTSIHQEDIQKTIAKFLTNKNDILGIEDVHITTKPIKKLGEHVLEVGLGRGEEITKIQVKIKIISNQ